MLFTSMVCLTTLSLIEEASLEANSGGRSEIEEQPYIEKDEPDLDNRYMNQSGVNRCNICVHCRMCRLLPMKSTMCLDIRKHRNMELEKLYEYESSRAAAMTKISTSFDHASGLLQRCITSHDGHPRQREKSYMKANSRSTIDGQEPPSNK
jgi:hypothetical protein